MGKTSKDEAYERFINRIWECPVCGGDMVYIGGLLDWQCKDCGALGSSEYNQSTGESYIEVLDAYSDGEIYEDPEDNKPYCCEICGGPYPDCISGCDIFEE